MLVKVAPTECTYPHSNYSGCLKIKVNIRSHVAPGLVKGNARLSFICSPYESSNYNQIKAGRSSKVSKYTNTYTTYRVNMRGQLTTGYVLLNQKPPGTHFIKGWWAYDSHLVQVLIIKIFIRTGLNFAHATTAQLLWHVQICYPIQSLQ